MVDYAQLRNLDTSKLTKAAETASGLSGAITARGGEVANASQIPQGMWAGLDSSAASGMMSPLSNPLYDVSDSATHSEGVITNLVSKLGKAQDKLDDAHDVVAGTGIKISADGTVTTPVVTDPEVAAENDRKAKEAGRIITQALADANGADDEASGALASVGEFLGQTLGPPQGSPIGPWATANWGLQQGLGRFGNLASWMGTAHHGRFAPYAKLPSGMHSFLSPKNMSAWQRAVAGAKGQFRAIPNKSSVRANWGTAGKWAGRAGGAFGFATGAATQASKDWNDPNMSTTEKVGRAGYNGALTGGGGWAGGIAGAKIGAGIGTLIAPGVGTVVGGALGGIVGGIAGAKGGTWIAEHTVEPVGDAIGTAGKAVGDAGKWVGDKVGDIDWPW